MVFIYCKFLYDIENYILIVSELNEYLNMFIFNYNLKHFFLIFEELFGMISNIYEIT